MELDLLRKDLCKEKINSVLIYHKGKHLFEYYKNNKQKEKLHKLNSCTKSVMSLLIGIAIDKGFLDSIHMPLYPFFPNILEAQSDKRKMEITIHHLVSMTDGLDFPEFGEWNSFAPIIFHHDIVKFVLDRPMIHPVGTHMNYNSGCSHILSAILQQVTKRKTEDFAKEYLFKPLEINEYQWYADNMKINKGADGLTLKVKDMMKIGILMLQGGTFNGKRVVSSDWIKKITAPNLKTYESIGYYGMHWWVNKIDEELDFTFENSLYFALGYGGRYIVVLPANELVLAVTSDLYNASLKPMKIIRNRVLRHLVST